MDNSDSIRLRFDRDFPLNSPLGKLAKYIYELSEVKGLKPADLIMETLSSRFLALALIDQREPKKAFYSVKNLELYIQDVLLTYHLPDPRKKSSDSDGHNSPTITPISTSSVPTQEASTEWEESFENETDDEDKEDMTFNTSSRKRFNL